MHELKIIRDFYVIFFSGCDGSVEVLAEGPQPQGGHVPQRAGGDYGRHGASRVRKGHAATFPTDRKMCLKSTLSGIYARQLIW